MAGRLNHQRLRRHFFRARLVSIQLAAHLTLVVRFHAIGLAARRHFFHCNRLANMDVHRAVFNRLRLNLYRLVILAQVADIVDIQAHRRLAHVLGNRLERSRKQNAVPRDHFRADRGHFAGIGTVHEHAVSQQLALRDFHQFQFGVVIGQRHQIGLKSGVTGDGHVHRNGFVRIHIRIGYAHYRARSECRHRHARNRQHSHKKNRKQSFHRFHLVFLLIP